jgi:hypothetical protein
VSASISTPRFEALLLGILAGLFFSSPPSGSMELSRNPWRSERARWELVLPLERSAATFSPWSYASERFCVRSERLHVSSHRFSTQLMRSRLYGIAY